MEDAPDTADAAFDALTGELRRALAPEIILLEKIATGGMGSVFLARDVALKRSVVVKVLSPALADDERARARFTREAAAAAAVAHPNVVAIHHVGQLPGSLVSYVVMQHIDGPTIAQAFPPGTVVPVARVRRIVGEIAAALATAHERGLVHRDIKPANVMLDRESDRAVVLDFGISAVLGQVPGPGSTKLTMEGSYIGTPEYMSPEQALGDEVTDRSDVYNLGLVGFELVTGRAAFTEPTPMALVAAHIHKTPPRVASLRPDLDPLLAGLIDRCLAKTPAERPSAAEIAKALLPSQARTLIEWPPPGLESVHRKGWALTLLATRLVAGVTAIFALMFFQPTMASGAWPRGETSLFWRILWKPGFVLDDIYLRPIECSIRASGGEACPPALADAGPLWLFAITLLALVVASGFLSSVRLAGGLSRHLYAGRRAGYPWPVVLDAAWDSAPDTQALLNGEGPFVMVGESERAALLYNRRAAFLWMVCWTGIAALMPLLWIAGRLVLGDSGALLVSLPEVVLVAFPLVAGMSGRSLLLLKERRVRSRGRRDKRQRDEGRVLVPASLVEGWLRTGDKGSPSATRLGLKHPVAAVAIPLALAFSALLAALPLLFEVHGAAMWHAATLRGWSRDWLEYIGRDDWEGRWSSLDKDLLSQIRRLTLHSRDAGRVVSVPGVARVGALRTAFVMNNVMGYRSGGREFYWTDSLMRDPMWQWLKPWQMFIDSVADIPPVRRSGIATRRTTREARRALAASLLAWEAGDRSTARTRLGEVLQVGRYMLAERPLVYRGEWGVAQAALELHERFAIQLGDTLTARDANRLAQRIGRYNGAHRLFFFEGAASALMADPEQPPGERYVGDSSIAPGVRRELALGAVGGVCMNGRELWFGMSAQRRALLDRVKRAADQLPGLSNEMSRFSAELESAINPRDGILGVRRRVMGCIVRILRSR